jgi:hypothetical protein
LYAAIIGESRDTRAASARLEICCRVLEGGFQRGPVCLCNFSAQFFYQFLKLRPFVGLQRMTQHFLKKCERLRLSALNVSVAHKLPVLSVSSIR